jgi:hypothetical protein
VGAINESLLPSFTITGLTLLKECKDLRQNTLLLLKGTVARDFPLPFFSSEVLTWTVIHPNFFQIWFKIRGAI